MNEWLTALEESVIFPIWKYKCDLSGLGLQGLV
jgi:hypothetical protein